MAIDDALVLNGDFLGQRIRARAWKNFGWEVLFPFPYLAFSPEKASKHGNRIYIFFLSSYKSLCMQQLMQFFLSFMFFPLIIDVKLQKEMLPSKKQGDFDAVKLNSRLKIRFIYSTILGAKYYFLYGEVQDKFQCGPCILVKRT